VFDLQEEHANGDRRYHEWLRAVGQSQSESGVSRLRKKEQRRKRDSQESVVGVSCDQGSYCCAQTPVLMHVY
jgi:hypothetical protein